MANISAIKVGSTSYGLTPASHASTATTYGAATDSNYGHVKLSDNYTSSAGAAASGIGASSLAVYNAYNTLKSGLNSYFRGTTFPVSATVNLTNIYNLYCETILQDTMTTLGVNETDYMCASLTANTESVYYSVSTMYGTYNGKKGHYLHFQYGGVGTVTSVSALVTVFFVKREILKY